MTKSIKLGVYDWRVFSVDQGFYPDDLPKHWRLNYFANEFESACINLETKSISEKELIKLVGDLDDSFDLSFSITDTNQVELLARVHDKTGCTASTIVINAHGDDRLLKSIEGLPIASTEVIFFDDLWTPENIQSTSPIALLLEPNNLKSCRSWIEAWTELPHKKNQLSLWVDANCVEYASLSSLRSLIELMGY